MIWSSFRKDLNYIKHFYERKNIFKIFNSKLFNIEKIKKWAEIVNVSSRKNSDI